MPPNDPPRTWRAAIIEQRCCRPAHQVYSRPINRQSWENSLVAEIRLLSPVCAEGMRHPPQREMPHCPFNSIVLRYPQCDDSTQTHGHSPKPGTVKA